VQSLREQPIVSNEVMPLEDPERFTVADSRFFYLKSSGSLVALEAMNGESDANNMSEKACKMTNTVSLSSGL
jgi:hypothetical protein